MWQSDSYRTWFPMSGCSGPRTGQASAGSSFLAATGASQGAGSEHGYRGPGSGPKGIRTPDLLAASQTLYQLSYGPSFSLVSGLEPRQPPLHSGRTAHNLLASPPCRRRNARRQV
jgi:hypothetical protein